MKKIILAILLLFLSSAAFAEDCKLVREICTSPGGKKTINGFEVYRDCWQYRKTYRCATDKYDDYCKSIASVKDCQKTSSICAATDADGICNKYINTYYCGSVFSHDSKIVKLDSEYTLVKDELDASQCQDLENSNCVLAEENCVESGGVRNINGKNVSKECWKYERKYSCMDKSLSDCAELEKNCSYKSSKCLSEYKGLCVNNEKTYSCNNTKDSNAPEVMHCGSQVYCLNGECESIPQDKNEDFASSVSKLQILKELKGEVDANNPLVFPGLGHKCSKEILGFSNCCKNDGWGKDIGLASCSASEEALIAKQNAGLCVYVGTYCSSKKLFGICTKKSQSFCCFPSKLSRIIQTYGRPQLNIGWGGAESPNCRAFKIEELQKIDFSKIDLRELFADIYKKYKPADATEVIEDANKKVQEHFSK